MIFSFELSYRMKSILIYGKAAYVLMLVLLCCLLQSLSLTEARDLRNGIVCPRGIALVMSTPEREIRQHKFGSLKLQATAENHSQKLYKSPRGKVAVEVVGRNLKEKTMVDDGPMAHSPGIGHHVPSASDP